MAEVLLAEPDQRGRTIIEDAVLEHIAAHAALEVTGVTVTGSELAKFIGRRLPKADAHVAGTRARVQVEVAVAWPQPIPTVASAVREHVTARLVELTGLSIDAVDVEVTRVVHNPAPQERRVQ
ncbi:Asp23/Gls24 family envelope stress response protein [Phycicoccus sp. KQZ13P-1]|uniref:Asp23/Gls24 family envelope stress response protein n=1 Tax=Phycicoccus mangrovi TaxID=2840470 RepID=UPI001C00519B|nr:Asp23/Gls24 family envelope stress response protein [Phycicoccus mangrovi]MBT9257747.1 Asp23/Gls24 family envelope stress response protein [Phycicoccus mangrovi]